MGLYTVAATNGPHVAPIAGGYIAQRLGWRWAFWVPAFIQSGLWVVVLLTFPETLSSTVEQSKLVHRTYVQKLLFHGKILDRKIRVRDFVLTLRMAEYAAVLLPALWFCTANTYGSALFAVTGSAIGRAVYKFNVEQTGLWLGIPSTIGCFIGEMSAGWLSDAISNTHARRHGGHRKPEVRLYLLPGCTLLAIGTATYGYCIQKHRPWIDASICLAVSGFGTQIGTTVSIYPCMLAGCNECWRMAWRGLIPCLKMVYLYATDSYKAQAAEIGVVMNFFKSGKSSSVS
jgi:MFS family permease